MKHHYVPQFLLRAWAKGSLDGKVEDFRLDLERVRSSRRAPKSTGYIDDLYALSMPAVAGMEKQAVEKIFLQQVDNSAAITHRKLVEHGLRSLTIADRFNWVQFIMSLRTRQPDVVQKLKTESADHLTKTLGLQPEEYEELAKNGDAPTLVEWAEQRFPGVIENFGLSFFHDIVSNPEVGDKISKMKWWIWEFENVPFDLLLADHACIFTKGIDDPNLIIALPISPKKAFMATNSETSSSILRQQVPKQLAMHLNEASLNQARTRIYARNASPMRFIQNRLHSCSKVKAY